MSKSVALFRGINVVGKNILPMKELKLLLEKLGLRNVETYIQSGNVVFRTEKKLSADFAKKIGAAVKTGFGFEPKILFLSHSELKKAFELNPFESDAGTSIHFFFLDSVPKKPDLIKIEAIRAKTEEYKLLNKTFYLYAPDGVGRSKLASGVEKLLGVPATARNRNTVIKLLEISAD